MSDEKTAPRDASASVDATAPASTEPCARCHKPRAYCVCDRTEHFKPRHRVVLLRHPQEADVELGTAPIVALALEGCEVITGLSWASLAHALGREVDPRRWAVLWSAALSRELTEAEQKQPVLLLDRKGQPLERDERAQLEGIIALDGTWSQAKTLWWRNPWLLKHPRVLLHPTTPSIYGSLRKEPKRESLSTLEAVTMALTALGEDPAIERSLGRALRTMCQRARDARAAVVREAPAKPKRDARKKGGRGAKARDKGDVL